MGYEFKKYLKPQDRILDIGAGAGEYSLYFAQQGYEVNALELTDNNIKVFQKKVQPDMKQELKQGNAVDLSCYEDNTFDIVLLFAPLYHLHSEADRQKCISEAKRVYKPDGTLFFAYISNDMVIMTEFCYFPEYFKGDSYEQYLKYHYYCCEKPEMLGLSNHLLFIGKIRKRGSSYDTKRI